MYSIDHCHQGKPNSFAQSKRFLCYNTLRSCNQWNTLEKSCHSKLQKDPDRKNNNQVGSHDSESDSIEKILDKRQTRSNANLNDCCICYGKIEVQGKLDSCAHLFCYSCIFRWSKSENKCPFCKAKFTSITKVFLRKFLGEKKNADIKVIVPNRSQNSISNLVNNIEIIGSDYLFDALLNIISQEVRPSLNLSIVSDRFPENEERINELTRRISNALPSLFEIINNNGDSWRL